MAPRLPVLANHLIATPDRQSTNSLSSPKKEQSLNPFSSPPLSPIERKLHSIGQLIGRKDFLYTTPPGSPSLNPFSSPRLSPIENQLHSLDQLIERKGFQYTTPSSPPLPPAERKLHSISERYPSPMRRVLRGEETRLEDAVRRLRGKLKFNQASRGSTGCTLLGAHQAGSLFLPSDLEDLEIEPNQKLEYVLKWVLPSTADSEFQCTLLAEIFGMTAPTMQLLSPETANVLAKSTKKAMGGNKKQFNAKAFSVIAMNRLKGSDIVELCRSGNVFMLKPNAWAEMMKEYGKAAIFDLFIANDDRFLRFDFDEQNEVTLKGNPVGNPGNVIIRTSPQKGNLHSVGFIDNGTRTEPRVLFGKKRAKQTHSEEIASENRLNLLSENLHHFFKKLSLNAQLIHDHTLISIINGFDSCMTGSEEQKTNVINYIKQSSPHLLEGIQDGYQRLMSRDFIEQAEKIVSESDSRFSHLIRKNLSLLNSRIEQLFTEDDDVIPDFEFLRE